MERINTSFVGLIVVRVDPDEKRTVLYVTASGRVSIKAIRPSSVEICG